MSDQTAAGDFDANRPEPPLTAEEIAAAFDDVDMRAYLDLARVFNRHNLDTVLDMPDSILATMVLRQLRTLALAHHHRLRWQGRKPWTPGEQDKVT